MSKLRVYEVAKQLGLENKAVVTMFQSLGVPDVRNHMSFVAPEHVERIRRAMDKSGSAKTPEEQSDYVAVPITQGTYGAPELDPRGAFKPHPPAASDM